MFSGFFHDICQAFRKTVCCNVCMYFIRIICVKIVSNKNNLFFSYILFIKFKSLLTFLSTQNNNTDLWSHFRKEKIFFKDLLRKQELTNADKIFNTKKKNSVLQNLELVSRIPAKTNLSKFIKKNLKISYVLRTFLWKTSKLNPQLLLYFLSKVLLM